MRIAIWLCFIGLEDVTDEYRHIAVSIDEPLSSDILSEPHKIWITMKASETYIIYDSNIIPTAFYVEVFDLPEGTHTLEIGVTSPYDWRFLVAAGNKALTSNWVSVNNQNYLRLTFNTADVGETGYCPVKILPLCAYYYDEYGSYQHNRGTPSLQDWLLSSGSSCGAIWGLNPNTKTQYLPNILRYTDARKLEISWVWNKPENDDPQLLCYYVYPTYVDQNLVCLPFSTVGMLTNNARTITSDDYVTIYTGHIENDAPTLNQFYTSGRSIAKINEWIYATDQVKQIYFKYPTCLNPNLPLPPSEAKQTSWGFILADFTYRFEAGANTFIDPSPGRRIYFDAIVQPAPNPPSDWAAWAFLRIPESPVSPIYTQFAIGPAAHNTGFYTNGIIYVTNKMLQQGYFTVEVGKLISKSLGTIADPPDYELSPVDSVYKFSISQVPVTSGKLASLTLSKSPLSAALKSLTLSRIAAPPVTAGTLTRLTLSKMPISGTLKSLTLSKRAAPPPPQNAILQGRIMGIVGPVAGAKVSLDTTTTTTARDGSFKVEVPPGTYTLTAEPTSVPDKLLYSTLKTKISLTTPGIYSRVFNMPINILSLTAATGVLAATLTAATMAKPKPKAYW
jgi:hypothetical protein